MALVRLSTSPVTEFFHNLGSAALSPVVSGSLLLALAYAPDSVRDSVQSALSGVAQSSLTSAYNVDKLTKVLQVLLGLGILRFANNTLSSMANNSGRLGGAPGWNAWSDELVVITGGCSGIGACTVQLLLEKRMKVAILDIQKLPAKFEDNHLVQFYKCDITKPEEVAQAARNIRRDHGRHPSIMINNAGVMQTYGIMDMPYESLQKIFHINTFSHWTMVKEFVPDMIKNNKGHVITIASLVAHITLPTATDYCASKAATLSFHEGLGTELKYIHGADGVLTSVVLPNFVRTPFVKEVVDEVDKEGIRLLKPEQVAAQVVRQLLSKKSGHVPVPSSMSIVSGLRGWPDWAQVYLRSQFGKAAGKSRR